MIFPAMRNLECKYNQMPDLSFMGLLFCTDFVKLVLVLLKSVLINMMPTETPFL